MPVLWAVCDSLSTPRPSGPLRDVARELGPEVTAVLREAGVQHEIFAAVLDALQSRACALVVEDLHWATRRPWTSCGSWPAASARCRCCSCCPTGRPSALGARCAPCWATWWVRRTRAGSSSPLSRAAVAELVDGRRSRSVDAYARTAGNSFFVSQILAQPDSLMPESVRDAVVATHGRPHAGGAPGAGAVVLHAEGVSGSRRRDVPPATVEALGATGLIDRGGRGVAFGTRSRARRCSARCRRARNRPCKAGGDRGPGGDR